MRGYDIDVAVVAVQGTWLNTARYNNNESAAKDKGARVAFIFFQETNHILSIS